MAYVLSAFLGDKEAMSRLAQHLTGCRVLELPQGLAMIPFNEVARRAAGAWLPRDHAGDDAGPNWPFSSLARGTAEDLGAVAGPGKVIYVEVEYFGNAGGQAAIGWQDGRCSFGPKDAAVGIVNEAVRFLGVQAAKGQDEFDTLGLGAHRRTEAW